MPRGAPYRILWSRSERAGGPAACYSRPMAAELRVMDIPPEGPSVVTDGPERAGPPPPGTVRWIDLRAQDEQTMKGLG